MKNTFPTIALFLAAAAFLGLSASVYTVNQPEQALVLQLGQPVGDIKGPGLHFKIPFVQEVRRFDRRILSVDPHPEQMVISSNRDNPLNIAPAQDETPGGAQPQTAETDKSRNNTVTGEPIIVDTFARWRITDPLKFMKTLRSTSEANLRLQGIVNDSTRSVLGNATLRDLLSEKRTTIMQSIRELMNKKIAQDQLGIEVVDVRIVRADLTPDLRQSTVRRMISELKERATQTRANGEEQALKIRSTAEKERTVILAEAERDAQTTRGEGDKTAISTYAAAYGQDKDFFEFSRTLEAYKKSLATPETRLILSPTGSFFKYFNPAR